MKTHQPTGDLIAGSGVLIESENLSYEIFGRNNEINCGNVAYYFTDYLRDLLLIKFNLALHSAGIFVSLRSFIDLPA